MYCILFFFMFYLLIRRVFITNEKQVTQRGSNKTPKALKSLPQRATIPITSINGLYTATRNHDP